MCVCVMGVCVCLHASVCVAGWLLLCVCMLCMCVCVLCVCVLCVCVCFVYVCVLFVCVCTLCAGGTTRQTLKDLLQIDSYHTLTRNVFCFVCLFKLSVCFGLRHRHMI